MINRKLILLLAYRTCMLHMILCSIEDLSQQVLHKHSGAVNESPVKLA